MEGTKPVFTTMSGAGCSSNTYISECKNVSHKRQWFGSRNPQVLKSSMCIGSVPVKWEVKFLGVTTVCYAGLPVTDTETNIQVGVRDNILLTKNDKNVNCNNYF